MPFDVGFLPRAFALISEGLATTLALAAMAVVLSLLWGGPVVMGLLSRWRLLRSLARGYVEVLRNTPVLVQMFFIFFGSGALGYPLSGFAAGLLALVLQNGAYVAEIYRAGIESVSRRQSEAGMALGLLPLQTFRIVVLPQAVRKVIPPLANQGTLIIKDTSLVATISVAEITFQARMLVDRTAAVFEVFFVLAAFYLVLTTAFTLAMRLVEVRTRLP